MKKEPIIVCVNDSEDVHTSCERVQKVLESLGNRIEILSFNTAGDFSEHLNSLPPEQLPIAYLFDSSPFLESDTAVFDLIAQFSSAFPEGDVFPLICFTSGNMDVALQASAKLWRRFPTAHVYLADVYADEEGSPVFWRNLLEGADQITDYPRTYGFRKLVNHLLGLELPLTTKPSNLGRDFERLSLEKEQPPHSLESVLGTTYEREETLFFLAKPFVEDYARQLKNGTTHNSNHAKIILSGGRAVDFNGAVGRAVSGPVIFHPEQISEMSSPPVLVVDRWPAGVLQPHFNSLAGIVVLSPYLADHVEGLLKYFNLCGVFGLGSGRVDYGFT